LGAEVAKQQRPSQGSYPSLPPDAAEPDPNYRATLEWVWSFSARERSPDVMLQQRALKLERMRALLDGLGHPEFAFPALLVAGTKGKGSTVAMLSACLRAAGYRTGRYTSPHLVNWRERTAIDGQPISTHDVLALAEPIRGAIEQLPSELGLPTTFEVGTAFAFLHFARHAVEVAVVEVGTGGRFDATNLVSPIVSAITPISYDHTRTLGATLASIAWHKAGIMRPGRPTIAGPQVEEARAVIETEAERVGSPLEEVGREWRWRSRGDAVSIESTHADFASIDVQIALLGEHQRDNAATAVGALHAARHQFPVSIAAIQHGLSSVEWPGRLQVLARRPLVVVDGAHNAASAEVVRRALDTLFAFDRLHLVLGLTEGKDAIGVLESLAPRAARIYLTRSHHERSVTPAALAPTARSVAPESTTSVFEEASSALDSALQAARPGDMVLVTGSLFLVGEALVWWRHSPR
jgi:dihydrofolate synthase/folylpolyglutamate synthase